AEGARCDRGHLLPRVEDAVVDEERGVRRRGQKHGSGKEREPEGDGGAGGTVHLEPPAREWHRLVTRGRPTGLAGTPRRPRDATVPAPSAAAVPDASRR